MVRLERGDPNLPCGDGLGAVQVDAIYPDIEKLYIDLHRHPELAFHEQRTVASLAARLKGWGVRGDDRRRRGRCGEAGSLAQAGEAAISAETTILMDLLDGKSDN